MYRMLRADLHRLFRSKLFYVATIGYAFLYTASLPFIMWFISLFVPTELDPADLFIKSEPGTAAIAIAVFVTAFLMKEFSEGSIRNKLSSGVKRSDIFLSSVITMAIAAILIQASALLSVVISGELFTAGFISPMKDVLIINGYYAIAAVSLAVFDATLMYIFAGNGASLFVSSILAVVMKFVGMMVLEDLFPESGEVVISGTRLQLFTFLDKYVPYMHLFGFPRYNWDAYVIGGSVLTVISVIVGILIFEKKDLK